MYNADNMLRFLGPDATNVEAREFAEHLLDQNWDLLKDDDGQYHAYRNGEEMTEQEWHDALKNFFG